MANSKAKIYVMLSAVVCVAATDAAAQYTGSTTTGVFPDPSVIETQLRRGVSSQSDVQRALGVPTGVGRTEMVLPPAVVSRAPGGEGARDVWYYDDIEISDMVSGGGALNLKERQQILLIFIKAGVFDGYLWTSNVVAATSGR